MRRNIYDILKNGKIDVKKEYLRIYELFYYRPFAVGIMVAPLIEHITEGFTKLDKRLIGRCLSIDDFNETYGYKFVECPQDFNIDYLISFSEYVVNFVYAFLRYGTWKSQEFELIDVIEHVRGCMEDIGYQFVEKDKIIIFVEKNPMSESVAEIVKDELSYSVLEYNHHALKGDLATKRNILKNMADDIENDRKSLNGINRSFTSDLFQLFNKFIRHDNSDNKFISTMSQSDVENVYDEIYQMWLLAKMQLEQSKRNESISKLLEMINE